MLRNFQPFLPKAKENILSEYSFCRMCHEVVIVGAVYDK